MAHMHAAFEIESQHGAIVVRDSASQGDLSNAVGVDARWYFDRDAAVFGVISAVDGPVRCEIWEGMPNEHLHHTLFREKFAISDALDVEDPAGLIKVEIGSIRGVREVLVLVDDPVWPERVQIVVDPGSE